MAKHRLRLLRRRHLPTLLPRRGVSLIDMVDISLVMHLMTPDAAAAGRRGKGRYLALCGAHVIPASLAEPGNARCQPCLLACVPSQRSRAAR